MRTLGKIAARRCRHYRSQQRGSSRSLVRLPSSLLPSSLWLLSLSSPALLRILSLLPSPSLLAPLVLARSSQGTKVGNERF